MNNFKQTLVNGFKRYGMTATAVVTGMALSAAGAQDSISFNVGNIDDTAKTLLTAGAGVTVMFAVYRVGRRAANRI